MNYPAAIGTEVLAPALSFDPEVGLSFLLSRGFAAIRTKNHVSLYIDNSGDFLIICNVQIIKSYNINEINQQLNYYLQLYVHEWKVCEESYRWSADFKSLHRLIVMLMSNQENEVILKHVTHFMYIFSNMKLN